MEIRLGLHLQDLTVLSAGSYSCRDQGLCFRLGLQSHLRDHLTYFRLGRYLCYHQGDSSDFHWNFPVRLLYFPPEHLALFRDFLHLLKFLDGLAQCFHDFHPDFPQR